MYYVEVEKNAKIPVEDINPHGKKTIVFITLLGFLNK